MRCELRLHDVGATLFFELSRSSPALEVRNHLRTTVRRATGGVVDGREGRVVSGQAQLCQSDDDVLRAQHNVFEAHNHKRGPCTFAIRHVALQVTSSIGGPERRQRGKDRIWKEIFTARGTRSDADLLEHPPEGSLRSPAL